MPTRRLRETVALTSGRSRRRARQGIRRSEVHRTAKVWRVLWAFETRVIGLCVSLTVNVNNPTSMAARPCTARMCSSRLRGDMRETQQTNHISSLSRTVRDERAPPSPPGATHSRSAALIQASTSSFKPLPPASQHCCTSDHVQNQDTGTMSAVSPSLRGSPCSPSTTPPLDACTQHLRALSAVLQSLVDVRGDPGGSERMLLDLLSCCGNALQDVTREVESRQRRLGRFELSVGAVNSFVNIIAAYTVTLQLVLAVARRYE